MTDPIVKAHALRGLLIVLLDGEWRVWRHGKIVARGVGGGQAGWDAAWKAAGAQ